MKISKNFSEKTIYFSLLTVEKIIKLLKKTYKEDLTFYEFYALLTVNYYGDTTMTDFAENLGIKKQQATRIINNLVEKGYVQRIYDESDRRIVFIRLTQEAKRYLDEHKMNANALFVDSMEDIGESEIKELQNAIETINRILPKMIV
ncbi:MAG: MarR family winged helix-turn-helix transcriptional regulator [Caldicoprobacterales bacterium]|jgi:DNA-binding MarR family transcriptional regulator|nr:MarR family transcriptional regulator [Clostridiales bacterium]